MGEHQGCRLAIVGSRDVPAYQSESYIKMALAEHKPSVVISGGAVGVDQQAIKTAHELGYSALEFVPSVPTWDAGEGGRVSEVVSDFGMRVTVPGGFKQRNEKVAQTCDCLVRIASATTKTYGSGWTADRAEALGKSVVRHTV